MQKTAYDLENDLPNKTIALYWGGVRKTAFGLQDIFLTKHPLIYFDDRIKFSHWNNHNIRNGKIADVSGVLLHYKFGEGFFNYVVQSINEENHYNKSSDYKQYHKTLLQHPEIAKDVEVPAFFATTSLQGFALLSRL